jgi:hypothetical protein
MSRAFVLGNGKSRLNIKVKKLRKHGAIYGCNALYREFDPDCLIAVDPKMIIEICDAGYQKQHQVWTNPNTRYTKYQNLNFFKNPRGWSSGPTALLKACTDGHQEIFILGFDYYGIGDYFNNVYADTKNYKRSTDTATFYGNWMRQTETVMKEYPYVKFFRVIDGNVKRIVEWDVINNFRHTTYDEMYQLLCTETAT